MHFWVEIGEINLNYHTKSNSSMQKKYKALCPPTWHPPASFKLQDAQDVPCSLSLLAAPRGKATVCFCNAHCAWLATIKLVCRPKRTLCWEAVPSPKAKGKSAELAVAGRLGWCCPSPRLCLCPALLWQCICISICNRKEFWDPDLLHWFKSLMGLVLCSCSLTL